MRPFREYLVINTGTGQVLTLIVSVILCLSSFAQDCQAYSGLCTDSDGIPLYGCCSEEADCSEGYSCLQKRGVCSILFLAEFATSCDVDSECGDTSPFPVWCSPIGECVGGDADGFWCFPWPTIGLCFNFFMPPWPCRSNRDCGEIAECFPFGTVFEPMCPGGTCVACVEGCSIATVTFGTELEDKTDVLRAFRDKYLVNNSLGKAFINAYYKYSPPVADYIAKRAWLRRLVRIILLPLIEFVSLFV